MRRWSAAWLPDPISAHVALGLGAAPCALLGLSGTGAPRNCRAGLPPLNCLGGPCFPPFICHFLWIQAHLYRGWVLRVVLGHNVQVTLHNDHD